MIPTEAYLILSLALFTIGVVGVLTRRNVIIVLMSIELILNAVNINLVAFSRHFGSVDGQVFAIFIITDAAAEAGKFASTLLLSPVRPAGWSVLFSESECLLPLWTKSPAGGGVQDCLWRTFSGIFAMPGLLFRLGPMVLSESCCGLGKYCCSNRPGFQFSRVFLPYGRGIRFHHKK